MEVIKPLIDELNSDIEVFHFFFEPHLLLRIRTRTGDSHSRIKAEVKSVLSIHKEELFPGMNIELSLRDDYPGEADAYSEPGWKIASRYMDTACRTVLDVLVNEESLRDFKPRDDPEIDVPDAWAMYLSHLYLNSSGSLWVEEAFLHTREALGRVTLEIRHHLTTSPEDEHALWKASEALVVSLRVLESLFTGIREQKRK